MCDDKGPDAQRLTRAFSEAKVDACWYVEDEEGCKAAFGDCCRAISTKLCRIEPERTFATKGSSLCPQQERQQRGARGR